MSAESRPDWPAGVLEAIEPSIFTPSTKRSTLTPAGGSRSVSGHFPAAGGDGEDPGRPSPLPAPCPDDLGFPPPQAAATRATTTNTRRRGDRIIRMGAEVLYRPRIVRPSVGDLCRVSVLTTPSTSTGRHPLQDVGPSPLRRLEDPVCSLSQNASFLRFLAQRSSDQRLKSRA